MPTRLIFLESCIAKHVTALVDDRQKATQQIDLNDE